MKFLTHPAALVVYGLVLGAAYGKKLPIVPDVARRLPNSSSL
jgi:hypothetical protein